MLVFALQHIGFELPIGIREIARCWIRHFCIHLVVIILHCTYQLSAAKEHVYRIIASPCIGVEYCLQTRAISKHPAHIRHLRGVEVRNIEFFQTRATIEHLVHIRHRRGVEVGNVECRQTRATREHRTHMFHRRGIEVRNIQRRQTKATIEH